MNQDYIDFMLGKKSSGGDSYNKTDALNSNNENNRQQDDNNNNNNNNDDDWNIRINNNNNNTNNIKTVTKAFMTVLVQEIVETDDIIEKVLQSVANLRERIYRTSQWIDHVQQSRGVGSNGKAIKSSSSSLSSLSNRGYGYRKEPNHTNEIGSLSLSLSSSSSSSSSSITLTEDDLQRTLQYDIIQHEKMLHTVRQLMSSLGQGMETLGRRVTDLLEMNTVEDWIIPFYTILSKEIYRKQLLIQGLFDSWNDTLLLIEASSGLSKNENNNNNYNINPSESFNLRKTNDGTQTGRFLAQQCYKQWSRSNPKYSYLYEYQALLESIQNDIIQKP